MFFINQIVSKAGVPIRLPQERWLHITEEHCEMAGFYYEVLETVHTPDAIYTGGRAELIAIKHIGDGKYLAVVYKEISSDDGFIITAFLTRRVKSFERRTKIWPQ